MIQHKLILQNTSNAACLFRFVAPWSSHHLEASELSKGSVKCCSGYQMTDIGENQGHQLLGNFTATKAGNKYSENMFARKKTLSGCRFWVPDLELQMMLLPDNPFPISEGVNHLSPIMSISKNPPAEGIFRIKMLLFDMSKPWDLRVLSLFPKSSQTYQKQRCGRLRLLFGFNLPSEVNSPKIWKGPTFLIF